jgi:HflK protein
MVVQYVVTNPVSFLFRVKSADDLMRTCAEATMRALAARTALDSLLTTARADIEEAAAHGINERLREYGSGMAAIGMRLQDVHPPLEVVDAFRAVSSAFEEKDKLINEAKAYAVQTVKQAEGAGKAQQLGAEATADKRINTATGDAARFELAASAYGEAPLVTRIRLVLETMEVVLAPMRKVIRGAEWKGRHDLLFFNPEGLLPKTQTGGAQSPAPAEGGGEAP